MFYCFEHLNVTAFNRTYKQILNIPLKDNLLLPEKNTPAENTLIIGEEDETSASKRCVTRTSPGQDDYNSVLESSLSAAIEAAPTVSRQAQITHFAWCHVLEVDIGYCSLTVRLCTPRDDSHAGQRLNQIIRPKT